MKLIKIFQEVHRLVDAYDPCPLEQHFRTSPNHDDYHMFQLWTPNTYLGFNYETT
ncbi:hypothetical protein pVco7_gp019 [Vibrio phage pVco-7]|uniref:Uncharacterized protein n=1 Tax=Vibrio phage pVco-5 TaxID=1965485 RepID=A0A1W6JUR2_9CAUD|nr:hypothetical protein KNT61_gp020 [Vibrio phage pVco-5]ARM71008.1 hypothetical protein pVco5_020 [Vibrio phage pVco-5]